MDRGTETKRLMICPVQAVDCRTARTFQSRTRHAPNGSQGMQSLQAWESEPVHLLETEKTETASHISTSQSSVRQGKRHEHLLTTDSC